MEREQTSAGRALFTQFPQAVYLIAAGAGVALHLAWQFPWPAWQWISTAGLLLTLGGLMMMLWAALTLVLAGTSPLPWLASNALVTRGPFRFSRNPIYLGDFLVLAGIGLWLGIGWLVLAAVAAFPAITRSVIVYEEAYLAERFPDEWAAYAARVRRWL